MADARAHLHQASAKLAEANLEESQREFEAAWDLWDEIFTKWPDLKSVDSFLDLDEALKEYRQVLNHQNKPDIPADFKLAWILDPAELAALEARQIPGTSTVIWKRGIVRWPSRSTSRSLR